MNVLVIEDDPSVQTLVKAVLEKNKYSVNMAETAQAGEKKVLQNSYDIIILDLGLPDGNGFDICKKMREDNITTPVLVLSAEQQTDVKIKCLRIGADDYITKPFDTEELLARIEAISRRSGEANGDRTLECGELEVNVLERTFFVGENKVELTNNEFDLLAYLMKKKNQTVSQEEISQNVWDIHHTTDTNYINVYISYLRKKIRSHSDNEYIETVRKKGFIMSSNNE